MYRRTQQEESQRITGQAAEWLRVMQDKPNAEERAAFSAWIALSQQHLQEFLVISMLDRELVNIDPQRRFDVDKILTNAAHTASVVPLREQSAPASIKENFNGHKSVRWAAGFAALAILLASAWWAMFGWSDAQSYTTITSEQRQIELDDGSIVDLNARSRLKVTFSVDSREVHLLEGEALFKVARDAQRPFRVHSGRAVIQAVGTQFNVNRRQSGTTVAVIEGRVKISTKHQQPANLIAGEAAKIAPDGNVVARIASDPVQVTAWRHRRLHFSGDTLAEIAEEFNRYNARQIQVGDEAARARHFNGVFDADDPDSFVEFLERSGTLEVSEGDNFIVRSR